DPLQRHASPDFDNISDLRGLWSAAERAQALRPNVSTNLYPFRASAMQLDKAKEQPRQEMYIDYTPFDDSFDASPGETLARTAWLRAVADLLDSSRNAIGQ